MLTWYVHLYVGEKIKKQVRRTMGRIDRRKPTPGVYLLTLPHNRKNVMEIVPTSVLLQETAHMRCPHVIGIARGREEAYLLMQKILKDTYADTGNFQVGAYLDRKGDYRTRRMLRRRY